jgi:hypothetical protein
MRIPDDDNYEQFGKFEPSVADQILMLFGKHHIRFEIDVDPSPGTSNFNGMGQSRSFVTIYVFNDDREFASKVIECLGHLIPRV